MNETDAYQYIRNLQALAHADGILTPNEEAFIESSRTKIGAKKSTLNKAIKNIDDHEIDIKPLSRFSTRIRNTEDLIELAMVDDQLHDKEKDLIAKVAQKGGITQDIINVVLREAKSRRKTETPKCNSCGSSIPSAARFCPECGVSRDEVAVNRSGKQIELVIPDTGITVAFADSTSQRMPLALETAKALPTYQEAVKDKKKWYAATLAPDDTESMLALGNALSGLRNKEVFINGQRVDWKSVFGFTWCLKERENAYNPVKYCFGAENDRLNIWGCRLLQMDWTTWSSWFSYGSFKKKSVFVFDMKHIVHELEKHLEQVRYCPNIRMEYIAQVCRTFPREAVVGPRTGWDYLEGQSTHPNAISVQTTRYGFSETIHAIGVCPRDTSVAKKIMSAAIKKTKQKDISLPQLGVK